MGARQEVFGLASGLEKAKAASPTQHEVLYMLSPGGDAVCGGGCKACAPPGGLKPGVIPCNPNVMCNASTLWRSNLFRMDHGISGNWVNGSWKIPPPAKPAMPPVARNLRRRWQPPPPPPPAQELEAGKQPPAPAALKPAGLFDVHDRWQRDIVAQFPVAAAWAEQGHSKMEFGLYGRPARAYIDMLPVGEMSSLHPRGNGLSFAQQQIAFTLWAVFGSPIVLGTSLVRMSNETLGLVTNREVLSMALDSLSSRQLSWDPNGACGGKSVTCQATVTWEVIMPSAASRYYGLFNLGEQARKIVVHTGGVDGELYTRIPPCV